MNLRQAIAYVEEGVPASATVKALRDGEELEEGVRWELIKRGGRFIRRAAKTKVGQAALAGAAGVAGARGTEVALGPSGGRSPKKKRRR